MRGFLLLLRIDGDDDDGDGCGLGGGSDAPLHLQLPFLQVLLLNSVVSMPTAVVAAAGLSLAGNKGESLLNNGLAFCSAFCCLRLLVMSRDQAVLFSWDISPS